MIHYDEHTAEGFVELRLDGKIDREGFEEVSSKLGKLMDERGTIGLLKHVVSFAGIEPSVLWADLKFAFRSLKHVGPVAVVSDKKWIEVWTKMASPFWKGEARFFETDELDEARVWLAGRMAEIVKEAPQQ